MTSEALNFIPIQDKANAKDKTTTTNIGWVSNKYSSNIMKYYAVNCNKIR